MKIEHNNLKTNNAKSRSIGVEYNNLKTNNTKSRSIGKTSSAGALLFAIITVFVMCMVGSTLILLTTNQYRIINSEIDRTIDFYLEQAGMEWAIYNLYSNTPEWFPVSDNNPATNDLTTHDLPLTMGVAPNTKTVTVRVEVYLLPLANNIGFTLNTSANYGIRAYIV